MLNGQLTASPGSMFWNIISTSSRFAPAYSTRASVMRRVTAIGEEFLPTARVGF
jgi:hypothetical protein